MSDEEIKKKRVEALVPLIETIWQECAMMIPFKDLLQETLALCRDRESTAEGGAAILTACGIDYEEASLEARIRKERSRALLNVIETLERTEKERLDYAGKKVAKQAGAAQLRKILGM